MRNHKQLNCLNHIFVISKTDSLTTALQQTFHTRIKLLAMAGSRLKLTPGRDHLTIGASSSIPQLMKWTFPQVFFSTA